MLQRIYVHNFRCLENFDLELRDKPSALLIGKNGVGKSTIASALLILQIIARGTNRMRDLAENPDCLLSPKDFARGRSDVPMCFEIEVILNKSIYTYSLAVELPEGFHELRVADEKLSVDGKYIYSRQQAQVTLHSIAQAREVKFMVDWHLAALPIIQEQSPGPLNQFKTWLSQMIILAPIPSRMTGISNGETLEPNRDGSNFAEWFNGLLSRYPAAYTRVEKHIRTVLPDVLDFLNKPIGADAKNMQVRFMDKQASLLVDFNNLSDGEKCYFLSAVVLAANNTYGPLFCFWDEPDSYLSISEVGQLAVDLRAAFHDHGQILITSHNPEIIRRFSNENTYFMDRKNHLEPSLIRLVNQIDYSGDLIESLVRGDISL